METNTLFLESEPPALRFLHAAGEPVRRLDYRFTERGGTHDAAEQLGLCEHHIIKSLVFTTGISGRDLRCENETTAEAVMVLMHGDERVSLHKLQRLSGISHLQPCSPLDAERLTGYKPGGICPFGLLTALSVFVQESLFELEELFINAGVRGVIAVIQPTALHLVTTKAGDLRSDNTRRGL